MVLESNLLVLESHGNMFSELDCAKVLFLLFDKLSFPSLIDKEGAELCCFGRSTSRLFITLSFMSLIFLEFKLTHRLQLMNEATLGAGERSYEGKGEREEVNHNMTGRQEPNTCINYCKRIKFLTAQNFTV